MQFDSTLNPNRPVPALAGNGRLVTTLGRTGVHEATDRWEDDELATQEFVIAGRRLPGPHRELIPFGRLSVEVTLGADESAPVEERQLIDTTLGEVRTRRLFSRALESSRSLVLKHRNVFLVERRISNHSTADLVVTLRHLYEFGSRGGVHASGLQTRTTCCDGLATIDWETHDSLGLVSLIADAGAWTGDERELQSAVSETIAPGDELVFRLAITFSDRTEYSRPFDLSEWDAEVHRHAEGWRDFWSVSEVSTGDASVDQFREISLYTIACQATPWSIPPTVSQRYWGAGAFHDEWYPFMGLLSGGWIEMARCIAYSRLAALPKAVARSQMRGALYPWSSTEDGDERDPHGHWYSERFHIGVIAGLAWKLWLHERRVDSLEELYPVIRECARYFEKNMIERDERGEPITKACTDFDESIGEVRGGPFTMAAAAYALDRASEAARRLDRDRDRRLVWDRLSRQLRQNFPTDKQQKRYVVPGNKPQHSSCLGYAVPFYFDSVSHLIRNTAAFFLRALKSEHGWKPGLNPSYEGTSWLWTAGHLGMVHALFGDGESTWECVRDGVASCGQFMSPNEHLDRTGRVRVPWFTTGCGAWLGALHSMFARVDQNGDYILCAVPEEMRTFSVRGLRLSRGVSVSVRVVDGALVYLSLLAPAAMTFTFEIPSKYIEDAWPEGLGKVYDLIEVSRVQVELGLGENQLV